MSKNHHNVQDVYINMFNGNMETKIKKHMIILFNSINRRHHQMWPSQ